MCGSAEEGERGRVSEDGIVIFESLPLTLTTMTLPPSLPLTREFLKPKGQVS